ncbi:invasion associated locus B family protein [Aurantiacibacter sp. MUD61]|uniref:invasion associated locus B family protein n=1 Tax=Aurantiacibacter sp. MUD61 TaxID=3009083 RepID=UPI0022F05716|nr:invasion associated locus B family protein [Aurantiacibacter sp. MUD61]
MLRWLIPLTILAISLPATARDSLGVFGDWGAFRDPETPRCYAIAAAEGGAGLDFVPFASVGTWPDRNVRGQVHFRLSRELSDNPRVALAVGGRRFVLTAGEGDAWATDVRADGEIVSAMRSASRMTISATDARGNRFTDRYSLDGAATAMDAARVGCAQ